MKRHKRPKMTAQDRLPGDPPRDRVVERMIRVDQAGEYGAARIYAGQLAVLGRRGGATVEAIREMAAQEARHLDMFNRLMTERRVRPTALSPLWHIAGHMLGAASALAGEKAAMACTAAVEEVIDEHYAAQAAALGDDESALRASIEAARADEVAHRDAALDHGAREAPAYELLSTGIKGGTRLAIWLSQRI